MPSPSCWFWVCHGKQRLWKMLLCSVTCGGQPKRSQLEIRFLFSNCTDFFSSSSAKIMMLLVEGSFLGTRVWGQAWCLRAAFTFGFLFSVVKAKKTSRADAFHTHDVLDAWKTLQASHMSHRHQLILNPVMAFGCKWADAIFLTPEFEKIERQQSKVQCSCSWSKTEQGQDRNSQLLHLEQVSRGLFSAATGCTGPGLGGPKLLDWAVGLSIGWFAIQSKGWKLERVAST